MTELKTLGVGDILYSSWGYDQTNIDFYEVTKVLPKSIKIRQIGYDSTPEQGFMTATKTPKPGVFTGEEMLKRPSPTGWVSLSSYSGAAPWDGKPKSYSWYA